MFHEQSGLHLFTFRGIEVSASFWYGLLIVLVVFFWGANVASGVLWAIAITISLLVHEFGHAFVAQRYRLRPSIMLHAFGGYCSHQEAVSDKEEAKIVFAGPLAGLALAGIVALLFVFAPGVVGATARTATFFEALLWVNLVWSLFNLLLPVYPLDGGKIFHLLMRRFKEERAAAKLTLNVSIFAIIPVAIIGLLQFGSLLLAFLALFIIMDNVQALQSGRPLTFRKSGRGKSKASDFHQELFEEAQGAMKAGDYREAARLCHHMRAVGAMPAKLTDKVWTLMGLATMEEGKYREALNYLERAPQTGEVKRAMQRCRDEMSREEAPKGA